MSQPLLIIALPAVVTVCGAAVVAPRPLLRWYLREVRIAGDDMTEPDDAIVVYPLA